MLAFMHTRHPIMCPPQDHIAVSTWRSSGHIPPKGARIFGHIASKNSSMSKGSVGSDWADKLSSERVRIRFRVRVKVRLTRCCFWRCRVLGLGLGLGIGLGLGLNEG